MRTTSMSLKSIFKGLVSTVAAKSRAGFSLVEILIVIGIVAALALVGATNYLGLRDKKSLDAAASAIASELRLASDKSKAQENNAGWGIRFTNGARDYYDLHAGSGWTSSNCSLDAASAKRVSLQTVSIDAAPAEIIFAKGTGLPITSVCASIASNQIVTISNTAGSSKTITVNTNGRIDY